MFKLKLFLIKLITQLAKALLAIALVIVLFASLAFGLNHHYRTPLQQFCSEVELNKPVSDVITLAEGHSFFILDMRDKYDRVGILNHRAHYFRYECAITVVNDVVTEAKMVIAD
ncbi:hypothetical protein Q4519_13545 [Motilimonas sp. 1_MG-2023]|uniref:hypothetical protein n=1 Tax=Motilimonas sp. 1_MG-2023 TaxID=3062672 RepID=UPI0026E3D25C|nr:hypothetical protein [Motilimonas sp. 1_MG-2023]MDO6526710.1 hypothetical protein [Motilimonas sp. 1_MG-2023]